MTYQEACDALNALSLNPRVEKSVYPYRTYTLLKDCGFNPDSLDYIHTAGSKGKGSLSRTAFQILSKEGINTGLFTSPHIFEMKERIEISSGLISKEDFANLASEFMPLFTQQQVHFFEVLLFMALVYFIRKGCTHVILEVGVGGRFDPTNFCRPSLVLMGHISLEHKEFLGGSLESIAYNKAGVLKKNTLALSQDQSLPVEEILRKEKAYLHFFKDIITISSLKKSTEGSMCSIDIHMGQQRLFLENILVKRVGWAALQNFALAAAGVLSLFPHLKKESILEAAQEAVPFRQQLLAPNFLADTAHNGQSFLRLCQSLDEWLGWKDITLYVSLLEGKEYEDIAKVLKQYAYLWKKICVFEFPVQGERCSDGKEFFSYLQGLPAEYIGMLDSRHIFPKEPTVWAGSFYSIEFLKELREG